MGLKYICYDGVEGDVTWHESKKEALEQLKKYTEEGLDDGEWYQGIENSFIAKISHYIKPKKIRILDEGANEHGITLYNEYIEMNIKKLRYLKRS